MAATDRRTSPTEQQAKQRELADLLYDFLELRTPEKPADEHYSDVLRGVCLRAAGRLIEHFVMTKRAESPSAPEGA